MWILFPDRSNRRSRSITGLVRVAENGGAVADLPVGIERWPRSAVARLIDAAVDPNAAVPTEAYVALVATLSSADGRFELVVEDRPAADQVDVLTVRAPARPGAAPRPLFAQLLSGGTAGPLAMLIELPAARLARVGLQVQADGRGAAPELSGLLRAARERAQATQPPARTYSQRYTAALDRAEQHAGDRLSASARRGPSLEVLAAAASPDGPAVRDVGLAIARLAVPEQAFDGRVSVTEDPHSGDVTVAAPALPLILRGPDPRPDPFAQRRLEERWASERSDR